MLMRRFEGDRWRSTGLGVVAGIETRHAARFRHATGHRRHAAPALSSAGGEALRSLPAPPKAARIQRRRLNTPMSKAGETLQRTGTGRGGPASAQQAKPLAVDEPFGNACRLLAVAAGRKLTAATEILIRSEGDVGMPRKLFGRYEMPSAAGCEQRRKSNRLAAPSSKLSPTGVRGQWKEIWSGEISGPRPPAARVRMRRRRQNRLSVRRKRGSLCRAADNVTRSCSSPACRRRSQCPKPVPVNGVLVNVPCARAFFVAEKHGESRRASSILAGGTRRLYLDHHQVDDPGLLRWWLRSGGMKVDAR